MSLRSGPTRVFYLECDRCSRTSPSTLTPVEAEVIAAAAGWIADKNPLRHRCPLCAEKKEVAGCPSAS